MQSGGFNNIVGLSLIAEYFDTSIDLLSKVISTPDQSVLYQAFSLPKKNFKRRGQYRLVYKALPSLAQLQKNIASSISDTVNFDECVQGFVKKRSTRHNAEKHLAKKFLLNADIKNFFESITFDQIQRVFINLGTDADTAKQFARICTLNGIPAQGLHTSPILSNLVAAELDSALKHACLDHAATYTRYADDISISSDISVPSADQISSILATHGFELNSDKFRVSRRGQIQYVTGLSVFDSKQPRIPRRLKRRMRLLLYHINKYGLDDHVERLGLPPEYRRYVFNELKGQIDYINSVEPALAKKFYELLPVGYA